MWLWLCDEALHTTCSFAALCRYVSQDVLNKAQPFIETFFIFLL